MSMSDRKQELERKKARLQALKEEKLRRQQEKEQALARQSMSPVSSLRPLDRKDLNDELIMQGIAPIPVGGQETEQGPANSLKPTETGDSPQSSLQSTTTPTPARKKPPDLSIVQVHSTSIPPKESVTYCKQTQTAASGPEQTARSGFDYYVLTYDEPENDGEETSLTGLEGRRLPPGILPHGMPTVTDVQPAAAPQPAQEKADLAHKKPEPRELSEEQKQAIMMSTEFGEFFSRQSRLVERALCEEGDVFVDYCRDVDDDGLMDDKSGLQLSMNRVFSDERWSQNRTVTSLDWSPQFPELLAASYSNNEAAPHDPDGVCLVWNTRFKKNTPEFVFHCQSPLMSATFARFHPNLLLGGTYSGQIVLWDNRVQRRTPVQRSPLSTAAHTHPVYCMRVVGTQNAHNLISVSTDGKLCSWSLDMLSQPQEKMDLLYKQGRPVPVTALAFPQGEVNNFVLGSEDGNLYTACRHGSRAGVQEVYQGHFGPVMGVSAHAAPGPLDFSHLVASSSIDWTIKLWSIKDSKPLYSFEDNSDYVYDVAWSPLHPGLLAAVDGAGRLDVWNLNADTEVPTASALVDGGAAALNKVSWTPSGLHITAGDDRGRVWVYDVGERLAQPRQDEWSRLAHTLQEMKTATADEELDTRANVSAGAPSR